MPDFNQRFPNKLESCLETPFGSFGGVTFYRGLLKKAAALFYFCINDHPFENGNKRFAVTAMLYLLYKNDYWLDIDALKLYNLAKQVAEIKNERPEIVINLIAGIFKPSFRPA